MCISALVYICQIVFLKCYERVLCFVKTEAWYNFILIAWYRTETVATQFVVFFFSCLFSFTSIDDTISNKFF